MLQRSAFGFAQRIDSAKVKKWSHAVRCGRVGRFSDGVQGKGRTSELYELVGVVIGAILLIVFAVVCCVVTCRVLHRKQRRRAAIRRCLYNIMQIVTGIEVNSEAYFPKLREYCPSADTAPFVAVSMTPIVIPLIEMCGCDWFKSRSMCRHIDRSTYWPVIMVFLNTG